jgi:tetratricopeptide (TPR) repeat protein
MLGATLGCGEPEPPPWTSVAIRGNNDATLLDDGRLIPLFASTRDPLGICIQALPEVDTSQWEARIWWDSSAPGEFSRAATRMASVLCFERQLTEDTKGRRLEACVEVRDSFDQSSWSAPCIVIQVLANDAPYAQLRGELNRTLTADQKKPLTDLLESLDSLSERAQAEGFPLLALRIRLIEAFHERTAGGPEGRERAARRLENLPPWIEQPPATEWAARVEQERYEIESSADSPNWSRMWEHLRRAANLLLATADSRRFTVAVQQAKLLAQAGSVARAIETLRAALDECTQTPCVPVYLDAARVNLAWLLITDPLTGEAGWTEAEQLLEDLLSRPQQPESVEFRANRLLNRAYLHLRQGRPLSSELQEARSLLSSGETGVEVQRLLLWADLLEGEAALRASPNTALERCGRAFKGAETPRLKAWAKGCVAESHRRRGDLEIAADAYEAALGLHERASPASLDQDLSVDVGRRADDFYRAARVVVELGRTEEAWDLLERLDSLSVGGETRACDDGEGGEPESAAAREVELTQQLAELERPASSERERQLEPVKRRMRQELAELLRRRWCSDQSAAAPNPLLPGLRAIPLEDEIMLLRREDSGAVRLVRRTVIPRTTITKIASKIASALQSPGIEDEEWRELVAPLAAALAPEVANGPEASSVRAYWLHGSLQGIPLAALPLPAGGGAEPRWLGEIALPALYPANLRAVPAPVSEPRRRRTFVVDPSLNLPSGMRLARFYRGMFPSDEVLRGAEATSSSVTQALRSSSWLHIDAHGIYDPAFPELSHLVLADGNLGLTTLGGLSTSLEGANLLGCWTGAWPITSDGGRHGLAGALARAGVPWTIASRTAVVDELAADFNEAFYPMLKDGNPIPLAYAEAMRVVRERWPASQWAAIMLVAGGPRSRDVGSADGQKGRAAAP